MAFEFGFAQGDGFVVVVGGNCAVSVFAAEIDVVGEVGVVVGLCAESRATVGGFAALRQTCIGRAVEGLCNRGRLPRLGGMILTGYEYAAACRATV